MKDHIKKMPKIRSFYKDTQSQPVKVIPNLQGFPIAKALLRKKSTINDELGMNSMEIIT